MAIKMNVLISEDKKSTTLTLADDKEIPLAHAIMNVNELSQLTAALLANLAKMQAAIGISPTQISSGMGKMPDPVRHNKFVFGNEALTDTPIIGFEVMPETWLAFEIQSSDLCKLVEALNERGESPKRALN